jgi:hypothetical protein
MCFEKKMMTLKTTEAELLLHLLGLGTLSWMYSTRLSPCAFRTHPVRESVPPHPDAMTSYWVSGSTTSRRVLRLGTPAAHLTTSFTSCPQGSARGYELGGLGINFFFDRSGERIIFAVY